MSFRFCFGRAWFWLVCVLALGAVGYTLVQSPFYALQLKSSFLQGEAEWMEAEELAGDPVAIRVCEELIADPHWSERLPFSSQDVILDVLNTAHSEALAPALRDFLVTWNRQLNLDAQEDQTPLAHRALHLLSERSSAAKRQALEQLEREFPPFPRPYAVALPGCLLSEKKRAGRELAASIIAEARRRPDAQASGWAKSRALLEDVRQGVAAIAVAKTNSTLPELAEAKERLWEIFVIQFLDGDRIVKFDGLAGDESLEFARALFSHLPEIPAINGAQAASFHFYDLDRVQSKAFTTAFEEGRSRAGGDLRKIHWLKKLIVLELLREHGSNDDLPFLASLSSDQSAVRKLVRERPDGALEERQQDANEPIPPGWKATRVKSFSKLADEVWIRIRAHWWLGRMRVALQQARSKSAPRAARPR